MPGKLSSFKTEIVLLKKIWHYSLLLLLLFFISNCTQTITDPVINLQVPENNSPTLKKTQPLIGFAYSFPTIRATVNNPISKLIPIIRPFNAKAYYIPDKTLPSGLILDVHSGIIEGTPKVPTPDTVYTIIAEGRENYDGPPITAQVRIEVQPVLSFNFTYSSAVITGSVNQPISGFFPILKPSEVEAHYMPDPNNELPLGLSLDPSSGAIKGIPTTLTPNTVYTITAEGRGAYSGTTATAQISIEVQSISLINLTYPLTSIKLILGQKLAPVLPTINPPNADVYYVPNNILPSGLRLNPVTGQISGTPVEPSKNALYTITAHGKNSYIDSSVTTRMYIEVKQKSLKSLQYIDVQGIIDQNIGGRYPKLDPQDAIRSVYFSIDDPNQLPQGLVFNKEGWGEISGSSIVLASKRTITITAVGTGDYTGSQVKGTINIEILPAPKNHDKDISAPPNIEEQFAGAMD